MSRTVKKVLLALAAVVLLSSGAAVVLGSGSTGHSGGSGVATTVQNP